MSSLGIALFCNTNLWQQSLLAGDFLIPATANQHAYKDCDVVVFTSTFYLYNAAALLPADLFDGKRKYKLVFIDVADGLHTPGQDKAIYQNVDIVLKSHYNKRYQYPDNFCPWQFGYTSRIANTITPAEYTERQQKILVNFRLGHKLRDKAKAEILPLVYPTFAEDNTADSYDDIAVGSELDQLFWRQSGRRHYPAYYHRLSNAMACACFGGFLQENMETETFSLKHKILYQVNKVVPVVKYDRIYQYDSFRFWEAFVAGTVVFHVDLAKLGAVMHAMPINGKHYLGVDVNNPSSLKKIMKESRAYFEDLGNSGKEWALTYNSPHAVAERFLDICENVSYRIDK